MKKSHFLLFAFATMLLSCSKPEETQSEQTETLAEEPREASPTSASEHSQTSLDWVGTYFNVLPCASCEGIETWVTLSQEGTFELKTNYLGLNDAREEIFTGTIKWDETGSIVQFQGLIGDNPGKYKIGKNQIWHLDLGGNKIEGDLAERYILKRK